MDIIGGMIVDWMVGGAPGEDVATFLESCPRVSFIGLNLYADRTSSVNNFRSALSRYAVGRNLLSITETNSDSGPVAPRLAFISVGEFGAHIFAPWALSVSYPTFFEPYVTEDGALANGALDGAKVEVSGSGDGQAIAIRPAPGELIIAGFRCHVSIWDDDYAWSALRRLRSVRRQRVAWRGRAARYREPVGAQSRNTPRHATGRARVQGRIRPPRRPSGGAPFANSPTGSFALVQSGNALARPSTAPAGFSQRLPPTPSRLTPAAAGAAPSDALWSFAAGR